MRSHSRYTRRHAFLVVSLGTLLFGVCFSGTILSCYACFSTPAMSTSLYTLQLDVSQVNLSLLFPPYSGYSTRENALASYSFENSGLSPVYRIGLFGYCGGEIIDGEFKKDHCIKNGPAYPLNPWKLLKNEINTNMTHRTAGMTESLVFLPDSLPSKHKMKRKSLDMYGGTMTGMGLALWCAVCFVLMIIGTACGKLTKGDRCFFFMMATFANFTLCIFWAFGSFVALAAGAGGAQLTYKKVTKAFNDVSDVYGITANVGNSFFVLIYAAMALEILFVFLSVTLFTYLHSKGSIREKTIAQPQRPHGDIHTTGDPEAKTQKNTNTGSNFTAAAKQMDLPPPTYEESQSRMLLGFFGLDR